MSDENVFHIPSGCKNAEEFSNYVHSKIMECLKDYKSKEATLKHLLDEYQIEHDQTNTVWDLLEIAYPDFFIEYEKNRKIREKDATSSTKGIEPVAENLKHGLSSLDSINSTSKRMLKLPHLDANLFKRPPRVEQEQVRGSTKGIEPVTEILKHSLSSLESINSTSKRMLKLPHMDANLFKRPRVEQEKVRGENEQSENMQDQNQPLPQETQRLDHPGESNQRRRLNRDI